MANDIALWNKYASELLRKLDLDSPGSQRKNTRIALAGTDLAVDFGNANPGIAAYDIFVTGNAVPASDFIYTPKGNLMAAYRDFLNWIDPGGDPDPNLKSQINIAINDLNQATQVFWGTAPDYDDGVYSQALARYKLWKQANGDAVSFNDWVRTNDPAFGQAQKDMNAASERLAQLRNQAYGPSWSAIQSALTKADAAAATDGKDAYNMQVITGVTAPAGSVDHTLGEKPGSRPTPSQLTTQYAPAYQLVGFTQVYQEWQQQSTLTGSQRPTAFSVSFGENTSDSFLQKSGYKVSGGADWFYDWFTGAGGGKVERHSQTYNWQTSEFQCKIDFLGFQSFEIGPVQWFDANMVETYHDRLRSGAPEFFGENGPLARYPNRVVLGFQPTITLSFDKTTYRSFKDSFKASASAAVGIGPFVFGHVDYSQHNSEDDAHFDDARNTITLGPVKTTMPILLAVMSTELP